MEPMITVISMIVKPLVYSMGHICYGTFAILSVTVIGPESEVRGSLSLLNLEVKGPGGCQWQTSDD